MFSYGFAENCRVDDLQNTASWLIIDSNETPGGLASTDVTKEGFVRLESRIFEE